MTSCFSLALALQGLSHSWEESVHDSEKIRGSEFTGGPRWLPVCPSINHRVARSQQQCSSTVLRVQTCSIGRLTDLKCASNLSSTLGVTSAVFFTHTFNDPLLGPRCPCCRSTVYLDWRNVLQMERYSQTYWTTLASGIIIPYHLQNAFLGTEKKK